MAELNPILHQPTRLRIMAYLLKGRIVGFARLREALDLTDGNLAGHVKRLEAAGVVASRRALRGIRFEIQISITPAGSDAMADYAASLRAMLKSIESDPHDTTPVIV